MCEHKVYLVHSRPIRMAKAGLTKGQQPVTATRLASTALAISFVL